MKYVIVLLIGPTLNVQLPTRYESAHACGVALTVVAPGTDRKCVPVSPIPRPSPFKGRSGK